MENLDKETIQNQNYNREEVFKRTRALLLLKLGTFCEPHDLFTTQLRTKDETLITFQLLTYRFKHPCRLLFQVHMYADEVSLIEIGL